MRGKTVGGIMVIFFFLVVAAYGQERQTADEVVQKMTTDFNLSPEQVSAVRPIIEDSMAKRQDLLNSTTDRNAIKDQMMQLRQEEAQKIAQILTPDQKTKMENVKEQRHQGMHGHYRQGAENESSGMGR